MLKRVQHDNKMSSLYMLRNSKVNKKLACFGLTVLAKTPNYIILRQRQCLNYDYKKPLPEIKDFDSVLDLLHARIVSQLNLRFKFAQYSRYPDGAYLPRPSANPLPQGAGKLYATHPSPPVGEGRISS